MQPSAFDIRVERRLTESGVRFTRGRRTVIRALATADGPRSASELYQDLRARVPLSSLYRSLTVLEGAGVLSPHHGTRGMTRYELAEWLAGHHHHLVCVDCGAVDDIHLPPRNRDRTRGIGQHGDDDGVFPGSGPSARDRRALRPLLMSPVAVAASDVVFAYDGRLAIAESSFTIPTGAITAVIGPNGAGKSTILGGISGLLRPVAGSLTVTRIGATERRIAHVLQTTKVNDALPITVREIVTMGRYSTRGAHRRIRPEDRAAVDEAMTRMAISDLANEHLSELSVGAAPASVHCSGSRPGPRCAATRRATDRPRHHVCPGNRRRHPR